MKVFVVRYQSYEPKVAVVDSAEEGRELGEEQSIDDQFTVTELGAAEALAAILETSDDYAGAHEALDRLLCAIAREHGYGDVADAWEGQAKWFE